MKLYLDTSTPTCVLKLDHHTYTWEAGHSLAEHLLAFIHDHLQSLGCDWIHHLLLRPRLLHRSPHRCCRC